TISEEWGNATHYMLGDMFSGTMNYRFAWALEGFFAVDKLSASAFEDRLATLRHDTPAPALKAQMNLIGSHDTRRALSACGGDLNRFKQMVVFQMSYPGAPTICYGDEAGLRGENDIAGRRAFPWGKEDAELMGFYRSLLAARRAHPALQQGSYQTLLVDDAKRLHAFVRRAPRSVVYALFNAGDAPAGVAVRLDDADSERWEDALGMGEEVTAQGGILSVMLPARSFAWYVPAED
ncbi:MAG: DUF3459 domain-containing protein, partial [Anaerolineae bacterium]|nr:DUF3459 domain-containing protein [Anaerolineae bacterium]